MTGVEGHGIYVESINLEFLTVCKAIKCNEITQGVSTQLDDRTSKTSPTIQAQGHGQKPAKALRDSGHCGLRKPGQSNEETVSINKSDCLC